MKITYVSIFPEIFDNFISTSLIKKAINKKILKLEAVTPRSMCHDRHQQVDDIIYGGGAGLLMKAKPAIDIVESVLKKNKLTAKSKKKFLIIFVSPAKVIFNQETAVELSQYQHLIFVCARYEGIDHRFEQYMTDKYPKQFRKISLGKFVTLGGEMPAMVMTEAIVRLINGVIKEVISWKDESYNPDNQMNNIEYPQYTRPENIYDYKVPEVLLNGHHKMIEKWKKDNTSYIN